MRRMNNYRQPVKMSETQSGAVLFTALVMMVMMTLLAVTMMGNTAMDEKMAQNSQEQSRAFQAAETGIEMAIANSNSLSTSNGYNAAGQNTFLKTDADDAGTAEDDRVFSQDAGTGDGYGVSIEYTSVFLQQTPTSRGSGFDSSFANYWFEIQSKASTDTGASSTVALGMFQVGAAN